MQNISSTSELREAIHLLEIEHNIKGLLLKEQFHRTYESLKPVSIIRSTLNDITSSPGIIDNVLANVVGLATGYLSKKIIVGASGNIFRKLFGSVFQIGVSNLVAHHPEAIKTISQFIFQNIMRKKEEKPS